MEIYSGFASCYDHYMQEVPYREWAGRLIRILREAGIRDGLVADLGCGTGTMTLLLSEEGYDCIGIDGSSEMLWEAKQKSEGKDILYLCQDLTSFELYGTVRSVVSVCDTMNYLLTEEELCKCFSLVNNYLDPGGLFLFDMNMPEKYEALGDAVIAENDEYGSFIWENSYDPAEGINTSELTFYAEAGNGLFRRFFETHVQRAYPRETIERLIGEAGLIFLGTEEVEPGERLLFLAKEHGK